MSAEPLSRLMVAIASKNSLLLWLNAAQNCFMIGMAGIFLLEQEASWDALEGAEVIFTHANKPIAREHATYVLPVHHVGDAMKTPELRLTLLRDFREYLLRHTLSDVLQHVSEYCRVTGQSALLLDEAWFNFSRVVRNALTHDGIVHFDPKKAAPPISFDRWTLLPEHEGRPIAEIKNLNSTATIPVLEAASKFVETKLA